ncbi:sensor histidine kinase [Deinococcus alpinitundrae]|uniref:sensor histidine kinase n=1 Tax=Deinococcus alpinitundrae TaxID=468913 RepID=UPI00137A59C9|nr:histidine kinase [Deinococcus alpinitundrae]
MTLPPDPFFPASRQNVADVLSPVVGRLLFGLMYGGQAVLIASLCYTQPRVLSWTALVVGTLGYLGFGLGLAVQSWPGVSRPLRLKMALLMSLCSLVFNLTFSRLEGFTALSLQVISAMVVATVVSSRWAVAWTVLQSLALAWANAWGVPLVYKMLLYPSYTLMQLFSVYLMKILLRERAQRLAMVRLNQELEEAQSAVAAASQASERHRIARDLHDTLGHNLTALGLELEFAYQVSSGRVREAVERAQNVNQQLLSEVRQTVNAIREPPSLTPPTFQRLEDQMRQLGHQLPAVQLHFECEASLRETWAPLGEASREILLKCAREALTNAVRHANASEVQMRLSSQPSGVCLRIENVARPSSGAREGHGLSGMRERLEAVGGHLRVQRGPQFFCVEAFVPLRSQP